jgi:hypothetical protein
MMFFLLNAGLGNRVSGSAEKILDNWVVLLHKELRFYNRRGFMIRQIITSILVVVVVVQAGTAARTL